MGFEKLVKFCIESAANSADQHAEQKSEQYLSPESEKAAGDASGNDSPLRPYIPVLDRISILLQYVRPKEETPHDSGGDATSEHPCKQVIGQILPLVLGILHQYKMSEKISEKGCRTLRYSLRCLGLHFEAYLADLVQNLVDLYTQNGFSCYLYLGGQLSSLRADERSYICRDDFFCFFFRNSSKISSGSNILFRGLGFAFF